MIKYLALVTLLVSCKPQRPQYSTYELISIGKCACNKFKLGKLVNISSFKGLHLFACQYDYVSLSYRALQDSCGSKEKP